MRTAHFGHLLHLYGQKAPTTAASFSAQWAKLALCCCLLLGLLPNSWGQKGTFNYYAFEDKTFYFGITLGYNSSGYRVVPNRSLIQNDSIMSIESTRGPGFNLGIVTNIEFSKNFDVRFMLPTLSFAERRLQYKMTDRQLIEKKVESVFLEFPIHLRYKSAPYKDTRLFVIAGAKYSVDLASNSRARRAEDLVKVIPNDFVLEYGVGFQIFFPYFVLSPEIKFSHGMRNLHQPNPNLIYSSPIDKLFSRGFAVSFHFEG